MKRKSVWTALILLGVVFMVSCGKNAKKAIDEAQSAVDRARTAEADKYAPDEFQSAESLLSKARDQFEEKEYKDAKANAISAKDQADLAYNRAQERKGIGVTPAKPDESLAYNVPSLSEEGIAIEEQAKAVLKDINFDFDRYDLTEQAKAILVKNAEWLKKNPQIKIIIEGHCDERGSEEYNLALGQKRAQSVRDYMVSLGISPARIKIISYGESMPLDPGSNEEAWAKNRRAHFAIQR